jgi:hypothetical protein
MTKTWLYVALKTSRRLATKICVNLESVGCAGSAFCVSCVYSYAALLAGDLVLETEKRKVPAASEHSAPTKKVILSVRPRISTV